MNNCLSLRQKVNLALRLELSDKDRCCVMNIIEMIVDMERIDYWINGGFHRPESIVHIEIDAIIERSTVKQSFNYFEHNKMVKRLYSEMRKVISSNEYWQ